MLIDLSRRAAEFFVDALEKDGAPEWMELAAQIREHWGMGPYPAGAVRPPVQQPDARQPVKHEEVQSYFHPEAEQQPRALTDEKGRPMTYWGGGQEQQGVVPTQYMVMREMFQPGVTYWICQHRKGPAPSRCELCTPFNQGPVPPGAQK